MNLDWEDFWISHSHLDSLYIIHFIKNEFHIEEEYFIEMILEYLPVDPFDEYVHQHYPRFRYLF